MNKPSFKNICVFANWYAIDENNDRADILKFKAVDYAFTAGYLSMENYVCTITGDISEVQETSFYISSNELESSLPNWKDVLSLVSDFFEFYYSLFIIH